MDADYANAASIIKNADFILFTAGAGASADSGLKVFAQMSDVPAYKDKELTYDQVASVDMLRKDPTLFFGFWIDGLAKYTAASPHTGYDILRKWKDGVEKKGEDRWFVATSNVDAFFCRSGFDRRCVSEIHGSVFKWQCGGIPNTASKFPAWLSEPCSDALYDPPAGVPVDPETMRTAEDFSLPCPSCGGTLRPNVYLFGDGKKFCANEDVVKAEAYKRWCEEVVTQLQADASLKAVVVEIGCGLRVPSLRRRGEELLTACPDGQCDLIRINPDYPVNELLAKPTVPIQERALAALEKIDAEM